MKALAPPAGRPDTPARAAAVQTVTRPPSRSVVQRNVGTIAGTGADDPRWIRRYQDWQAWARRYAKTLGAVRFVAGITSDVCARCLLRIEQRDSNGDWQEAKDQSLRDGLDDYRNELESRPELIRAHAWHYQVAGEMMQVVWDAPSGVQWGIFSRAAVRIRQPTNAERKAGSTGTATVMMVPNGNVLEGTAFTVPREQVTRLWLPDEEWKGLATSPMAAVIDDLHRYRALARWVQNTADSAVAMNGAWWTPGEAHEVDAAPGAEDDESTLSQLDKDYIEAGSRRFSDDDDVLSVLPFPMHWEKDLGPPQWVKIGDGLDPQIQAGREEALGDFGRGVNMPASLVTGGGSGDGNHWSEWLVDDRFFDSSVAPTMDRITHTDLTSTYLTPQLRMRNLDPNEWRVGYDPQPVIVRPDQSEHSLKLYLAGLLAGDATLEASNFDINDKMGADELAHVLDIISRGRTEWNPAGPQDVVGQQPTQNGPPTMDPYAPVATPRGASSGPAPAPVHLAAPAGRPRKAATVLAALNRVTRDLGRELKAGAELALEQALRHASRKAGTRVQSRVAAAKREDMRKALAERLDEDGTLIGPLGPYLAALGVTEAELLDGSFDSYATMARKALKRAQLQRMKILDGAGLDARPPGDDRTREAAAAFAAAALLALAYRHLTEGAPHQTQGERSGNVASSIIAATIQIADGRATVVGAPSPDLLPAIAVTADVRPLELEIGEELDTPIEYAWEWGFYGDPTQPFEPHQDLGMSGFTTTQPDDDPALVNEGSWPDVDFYAPQDHEGCTCTWLPTAGREGGPGERPVMFPNPGTTALEAAGLTHAAAVPSEA